MNRDIQKYSNCNDDQEINTTNDLRRFIICKRLFPNGPLDRSKSK